MRSRCLLLGAMLGLTSISASAGDWPQFRGPGRDNRVTGFTAPAAWPKELKKEWSVTVGAGVSSPAMVGGKLYVFTRVGGDEVITCLDAASGKEVWKEKYACDEVKGVAGGFDRERKFAGTRSTPAVGEGKVCTFSVVGRVSCFDAATGKPLWHRDTKGMPQFYTSTSPLIAEGKCIIHTGRGGGKGKAGSGDLVAYDLATGAEKWKWNGDGPGYGSPILATIHGVKQVVELTDTSLIGVGLADGKLLWKTALKQDGNYQSATPIVDGNTVICAGSAFAIEKSGDAFMANRLWKERSPATYNTPVLKGDVIYGLVLSGGGKGKGGSTTRIFAQDVKKGSELWQDKSPRGECGAILDAGDVMLMLTSDSNLVAFKPDKEDFKELARYKVSNSETYAMPIIDGKRIYVKDKDALILWTLP